TGDAPEHWLRRSANGPKRATKYELSAKGFRRVDHVRRGVRRSQGGGATPVARRCGPIRGDGILTPHSRAFFGVLSVNQNNLRRTRPVSEPRSRSTSVGTSARPLAVARAESRDAVCSSDAAASRCCPDDVVSPAAAGRVGGDERCGEGGR